MSNTRDKYRELSKSTVWNTITNNQGQSINNMATPHLFNCLKMMYNHLAVVAKGPRIMFTKEYPQLYEYWKRKPDTMVEWMKIFIVELDDRKDLRGPKNMAFAFMKQMLKGKDKKDKKDYFNIMLLTSGNNLLKEKEYSDDEANQKQSKKYS